MSKTKATNPPRAAGLNAQLRWYLKNCETIPLDVAGATDIHHTTIYRFLNGTRGLSHDAQDRLARHLRLRLVRE